jgi:hypothetical protein
MAWIPLQPSPSAVVGPRSGWTATNMQVRRVVRWVCKSLVFSASVVLGQNCPGLGCCE